MERGTFRKIFLIICKCMDGVNNKRTKFGGVRIHQTVRKRHFFQRVTED